MSASQKLEDMPVVGSTNLSALRNTGSCEFALELQSVGPLYCHEIVRIVPARRLVCKATWGEREVYCKLFLGHDAEKYAGRDFDGVTALQQAGIATPALLYAGSTAIDAQHQEVRVLVFEALADSRDADEVLKSSHQQQKWLLMCDLVIAVAEHHAAGLMQVDLYPKNFLVHQERIYTIDGDGIRQLPRMRRTKRAAQNLAILLSKFDVVDIEGRVPELLDVYRQRCKLGDHFDADVLAKAAAKQLKKVVGSYVQKKVFRQCTDVSVWRNFSTYLAISRQFDESKIAKALATPDELFESHRSISLKQGNTCTVALAEIAASQVVIKRYNIKSFWHGVSRAFRTSRAAISWSNAFRLNMYGIATPKPIALLEQRLGPMRRQAYLLTEYLQAPDVDAYFANTEIAHGEQEKTARYIVEMFYRMKLLKITHGDLKASNIKVSNGLPLLIDLDSLREHDCSWRFNRLHVRDLRRFMRNWPPQSTVSSLLAVAFNEVYQDSTLLKKAGILTKSN